MDSLNIAKVVFQDIFFGLKDSILGVVELSRADSGQIKKENVTGSLNRPVRGTTQSKRRGEKAVPGPSDVKDDEQKILPQLFILSGLNLLVCTFSYIVIYQIVVPGIHYFCIFCLGEKFEMLINFVIVVFEWLWIIPISFISKILNIFYYQDFANIAFKKKYGPPKSLPIGSLVSDFIFSIAVQSIFLLQGYLCQYLASYLPIPHLGISILVLHMSMLYSLYAFDYKWFNLGWPLHKRLYYIESNLPYFIGFGLLTAIITSYSDSLIFSGFMFSIFFPFLIFSANQAKPLKVASHGIKLKIFSLSCWELNKLFHIFRAVSTFISKTYRDLTPRSSIPPASGGAPSGVVPRRVTLQTPEEDDN